MNKGHSKNWLNLLISLMLVLILTLPALAAPLDIGESEQVAAVIAEEPEPISNDEQPQDTVQEEQVTEPTLEPTEPPTAKYEIQTKTPEGWYANRAVMELTIVDLGGTGWENVCVIMQRGEAKITLVDGLLSSGHLWIDLLDNCIIKVEVTDPYDKKHDKDVTISCFDKVIPNLTASVVGETLYVEANDAHSGIAAVQVNGTTYTALTNGKLEIALRAYADAYEQLLVQAVDSVGNVSKAIAVANPFYKDNATPSPVSTATPAPAPTATPKPTPKPTKKPPSGGGGSSSNGNNGNTTTATATPTVVPTTVPAPAQEPVIIPAPIVISQPLPTIETGVGFNQNGNSVTRDLLYDKHTNKQFIAIETRGGDVFYIVIDYDKPLDDKGEQFETYFLNLVDSRDMLDIVGESEAREPEIVYVTPEPTVQPPPAPVVVTEPETQDTNGSNMGMLGIAALLTADRKSTRLNSSH